MTATSGGGCEEGVKVRSRRPVFVVVTAGSDGVWVPVTKREGSGHAEEGVGKGSRSGRDAPSSSSSLPAVMGCGHGPVSRSMANSQAPVYDILPSTTAVFSYVIGS